MLKRKKSPKITNCEVLIKKGPIILKIYRGDGSEEVISNLKVSDLHLAEWREVIQACLDKSEKGWKTIFDLVKTRLDQLTQTEQELKIDLNKPLKEQDPLNVLNELAKKKRKRTSVHSHCMAWFEQLETHLRNLYLNSSSHAVDVFKLAFHSFFGEEHQTFRLKMSHNLDQLRLQLERENLLEISMYKQQFLRDLYLNAVDADIRQHTGQSEPTYDTYLLEKVNSNTTPDSTNMSHKGGEID
ncbi:hypothetical protein Tco_0845537 [Tanacetum coccineum]